MQQFLIAIQVIAALLSTKTGSWVQTVGAAHYQVTVTNQGAPGAPIGAFTLTEAIELGFAIEFGGAASQEVRVGNTVFLVSVVEIAPTAK